MRMYVCVMYTGEQALAGEADARCGLSVLCAPACAWLACRRSEAKEEEREREREVGR